MTSIESQIAMLKDRAMIASGTIFDRDAERISLHEDIIYLEEMVCRLECEAESYRDDKRNFVEENKPCEPNYLSRFEVMEERLVEAGVSRNDLWKLEPFQFAEKYRDHWAVRAWFAPIQFPDRVDLIAADFGQMRKLIPNTEFGSYLKKGSAQ